MEINRIDDIDKFGQEFDKAIDKALIASAYRVRDKAQNDMIKKYPKTEHFKDGVFVGRLNNKSITISAFGSDGDNWKARLFIGGAPKKGGNRYLRESWKKGTLDKLKKPASRGKIEPTNSLSIAFEEQKPIIKEFFNNLKIEE